MNTCTHTTLPHLKFVCWENILNICLEIRKQFAKIGSLLPCAFQGSNSGPTVWDTYLPSFFHWPVFAYILLSHESVNSVRLLTGKKQTQRQLHYQKAKPNWVMIWDLGITSKKVQLIGESTLSSQFHT